MSLITQHSRIKLKRSDVSGIVPTIPESNDHTDGTWTSTDIYVGELFMNTADNVLWIRTLEGIVELGATGPQGVQGPQGFQGFQGVQGPQGFQGFQGVQGPQGFQGVQGPQGFQGFQGVQGPQGFQGFQGVQGPQGFQGFQGVQGPQGFQGFQGVQGPQGFQGLQGVQGPQGFQGLQGPRGFQGLQGPQGYQGVQGAQGPQGFQGVQGVQGVQGPQGFQGVQGLRGPQGYQGVQGVQGPQGFQGVQGLQGPQGYQGVQGVQGPQGFQGFQGLQGPQGYQGVQGVQGPQGFQGFQGLQGPQGFQGVQGLRGPQGYQGVQGVQGPQGFQGVQGPQGFQGVQGPQGFQGPIIASHGLLSGLDNDDHVQYLLKNGSRLLTNIQSYSSNFSFTADENIISKKYVDDTAILKTIMDDQYDFIVGEGNNNPVKKTLEETRDIIIPVPVYGEIFETNDGGTRISMSDSDRLQGWRTGQQGILSRMRFNSGEYGQDNFNSSKLIIDVNGTYKIEIFGSATISSSSINVTMYICNKNIEIQKSKMLLSVPNTSTYITLNSSFFMELYEGDYLDIRFYSSSGKKSVNLDLYQLNLNIKKISK